MPQNLILQSLEIVADKAGEISETVYQNFYSNCPESEQLMAFMDSSNTAKMMAEVYRLLLLEDYEAEQGYLSWEVENHGKAYHVKSYMYEELFTALLNTIRGVMGELWSSEYESAWQQRIAALNREIAERMDNH